MNNRYASVVALAVAVSLAAAACSSSSDDACDGVRIENAWVRLPPGPNTALYMDITNTTGEAFALSGASSDFAATYELHESKMSEGQMIMVKVPGQEIPVSAGATTKLEPGGLHVMAIDIQEPLAVGDEKTFTLTFTNECSMEITAPVEAAQVPGSEG